MPTFILPAALLILVTILTEVIQPSVERAPGKRADESGIMQPRKTTSKTKHELRSKNPKDASALNNIRNSSGLSYTQRNSKVLDRANKSKLHLQSKSLSSKPQVKRRSSGHFLTWNPSYGRDGMNPCVRRIRKTYHSELNTILTDFVCRRATLYCSPKSGGAGKCMPLRAFITPINKVLTTGCTCRH